MHLLEVQRLVQQFEHAGLTHIDDCISIFEAGRYISGRPKPWGPIIQALLHGQIPFLIGNEDDSLMKRVSIAKSHLADLTKLTFHSELYAETDYELRWSQVDALEVLNGIRDDSRLVSGLTSTGSKPKYYLASEVRALAARAVSIGDLARRSGIAPRRVYILLEREQVTQLKKGLWARGEAERSIGL